jgi:hypothetical protein
MENWSETAGPAQEPNQPDQPADPNQAGEQPQPQRPWGSPAQEAEEPRYLGLSPAHFNVAFFAVLGVIALAAFLFLGGAGAIGDLVDGDEPAKSSVSTPRDSSTTDDDTSVPPLDGSTGGTSGGSTVANVLGTIDPLSMVGALTSGQAPTLGDPIAASEGDGSLKDALLREGDLPAGFQPAGEMTFSMPVEGTTANMAMNMFATGDIESGDFGAMAMSAAIEGEGLADMADFDSAALGDAELAEMQEALGGLGIGDVGLLDATGLGEGGFGMHVEMDLSELLAGFGDLAEISGEDVPTAFAFDMYMWVEGDRMYMVMVMWTPDSGAGVDGRALADVVDGRAGG